MAGPGDALAKEGRNMQKGFQDAHDLMMGQRPDGQYEVHGWADAQTIGPGEDSTEVTPMYSGPDVENDPLAFGPASAPAEEPDVSGDTYMAPAYDPTVGPAEQNDPLAFGPDESSGSYDPSFGPDPNADWGPAYDPEIGPDAANDEPALGPDPQEPDM